MSAVRQGVVRRAFILTRLQFDINRHGPLSEVVVTRTKTFRYHSYARNNELGQISSHAGCRRYSFTGRRIWNRLGFSGDWL